MSKKPHSLGIEMAQILKRLYLARKARREARKAFGKYLAEAWGETDGDENGPGSRDPKAHKFGQCGLGHEGPHGIHPVLCDVCLGSEPFHAAYLKATREAGNALRQAQAWGKRFAEDER